MKEMALQGEIGLERADEVSSLLEEAAADAPGGLRVDLGGVTYMDSSGIAVLIGVMQSLEADGRGFELAGVPQDILRIFEIARLDRVFTIV